MAAQKLYLQVGLTALPQCEVKVAISKESLLGQVGYRHLRREVWEIIGVIPDATQSTLHTTIGARQSLFSNDQQDLRLKFADGTDTQHVLLNSGTLNGVRFRNFQWLAGLPGQWGAGPEYATVRTYRVIAEADVIDQEQSDLFSWQESIEEIGNGGPDFTIMENLIGFPTRQDTKNFTAGMLVQMGTAIGFLQHPTHPEPVFPGLCKPKDRRRKWETPKRFGRQQHAYHTIHWHYLHLAAGQITGGPPPLPAP